ncbi:Lysophospholipase L1 [Streptoalloteichus tenebrarius]|uniref:Lysophospholipase L1 n=1 Tax=Streptoalloteichus tenebrarius (strain ATCC 17920 / DSM 40477 / JCM 4838 / CBS 697.72 / NBRC 16177 / NCIMB 11028 / NRRL B-12390 / A12253. 1 / ISP 5477) TaxID=1933 RepID=A0ABT1HTV8_STRSD|nr:SGNH/GDSL hydrolase family protein [Streptoalloteichus tenebrarius]MCP2258960.1 Lysophospholipase L1 [Streptoalloteichus tenebrarius]BFF01169.1 SGNH/GDSL hydrolase family protein [Streptoalloteichus tenebrarius]
MIGVRVLRAVALATGAIGGLSGAAYGLLTEQSRRARRVIGVPEAPPLRADGVYLPDGSGPLTADDPAVGGRPLTFAVLGDSSAAGVGVDAPEELPGVLLTLGLAAEAERPVRLVTHAVSGATTRELPGQVDAALVEPPDLALVIIGANDVTTKLSVRTSAELLGEQVGRLRAAGVEVVVGTCPDLGAIRPIPQPLRSVARTWSLALARAQRRTVEAAGGHPVPLADLLSPEFLTRPAELFSTDQFHPSAAGYAAAREVLLPTLCVAASLWTGPVPVAPTRSAAAEARRPTARIVSRLNRALRRAEAARFSDGAPGAKGAVGAVGTVGTVGTVGVDG